MTTAEKIIGFAARKDLSASSQKAGGAERRWWFRERSSSAEGGKRLVSPASGLKDDEALDFLRWLSP